MMRNYNLYLRTRMKVRNGWWKHFARKVSRTVWRDQWLESTKQEFKDAVKLRYNWPLERTLSFCTCGTGFNVAHALSCKKGGVCIVTAQWSMWHYRKIAEWGMCDVRKGTNTWWSREWRSSKANESCTWGKTWHKRSQLLDSWWKSIFWRWGFQPFRLEIQQDKIRELLFVKWKRKEAALRWTCPSSRERDIYNLRFFN